MGARRPQVAAQIERAHHAAVADALAFIEQHALFTRTGTNGVRQVDVRGLVGTAFTHRDSRAGDPDLHTHVAVANKVQTLSEDRWLSHRQPRPAQGHVTALRDLQHRPREHLAPASGLGFAERPGTDRGKRPVREIVGVDPALNPRWSSRRRQHRGPPRRTGRPRSSATTAVHRPRSRRSLLAQQATLETREAKHEPRTLDRAARRLARRRPWTSCGSPQAVSLMVATALSARRRSTRHGGPRRGCGTPRQRVRDEIEPAAPPGRSGTSAPKRSATCAPRACPPSTSDTVVDWSSTTP